MPNVTVLETTTSSTFNSFEQIVANALSNQDIVTKTITEKNNTATFEALKGYSLVIGFENMSTIGNSERIDYYVELYNRQNGAIEFVGKKYRDNPQDIAEVIIRFSQQLENNKYS